MESNTTPKKSSTAFGRGIKKVAQWVARMFGYKAESKFGRAIWYVFITAVTVIAVYFVIGLVLCTIDGISDLCSSIRYNRLQKDPTYCHPYYNKYVSPYIIYHYDYPCYLYDTRIGRRTMTDVYFVCTSPDGDSLTFFSDGEKRGYFNRFTAQVAIPAQYEKAWVFSEGLACVMSQGALSIIDHSGQPVIDKTFPYKADFDYCFHGGLCAMQSDNGSFGLIDRKGDWVVAPEYDKVIHEPEGFWRTINEESHYGLLDAQGKTLLPINYEEINIIHDDSCIYAHRLDHIVEVLDYNCNVINPCHYSTVNQLTYETDQYDEDGDMIYKAANCLEYYTDDYYYGLMDKQGNIVTPTIYSEINAIGPDRYHCVGPKGSVILNDKGQECGENNKIMQND